ncbi:MAG: hypothetical protein E7612_02765 [Ruminococcaceae bacterium]|nr:hypothetical protein [Oscillospiraceae bacterium]
MKKSQITYAIWPWGTQTKEQAEEAARDVTAIGYTSFESVKMAMYAYDLNHEEYKAMLDSYGLKAVSFYFHIPPVGQEEVLFGNLEKELEFVKAMGVNIVTLQGTNGRPEVMDDAAKKANLDSMVKFATIAKKYGITTNVHPHVNTYFMYEDEVDYVMENTDPNLISLAPDTAHIAAAGADPVKMIKKYIDRVKFIHLKDYKFGEGITSSGWVDNGVPVMTCYRELGKGTVDFPSILKILDGAGYEGPLCIELDRPPVSNVESAKNNFDYLSKLLED